MDIIFFSTFVKESASEEDYFEAFFGNQKSTRGTIELGSFTSVMQLIQHIKRSVTNHALAEGPHRPFAVRFTDTDHEAMHRFAASKWPRQMTKHRGALLLKQQEKAASLVIQGNLGTLEKIFPHHRPLYSIVCASDKRIETDKLALLDSEIPAYSGGIIFVPYEWTINPLYVWSIACFSIKPPEAQLLKAS